MESIVLKAIMERYGGLTNLYSAMDDCIDTVLVNLTDDVNYVFSEDEIYEMIQNTIQTDEIKKSL